MLKKVMYMKFDYPVSPIEYGHVLLIPRFLDCLPHRIDRDSFWLALHKGIEAADPSSDWFTIVWVLLSL